MNDTGIAQIKALSNGAEILNILRSRGFEYLLNYSDSMESAFYFSRGTIIIKTIVGSFGWDNYLVGMWVYCETFNLNLSSPSSNALSRYKPMVDHNNFYFKSTNVEEFEDYFDIFLRFEDDWFLVDNLKRYPKSPNEPKLLDYLENCFSKLSSYPVSRDFVLA